MNRNNLCVAVRADASSGIGWGHAMRCIALSSELRRRGARVTFVAKPLDGPLPDLVGRMNFECELLENDLDESRDACATIDIAARHGASVLIVDHYGLGPKAWAEFRRAGLCLAVVDDLAQHTAIPAHVILNQNVNAAPALYSESPSAVKLCGPRYALLRDSVRAACSNRIFRNDPTCLVITLGGADPDNLTSVVLEEASRIGNWKRIAVAAAPSFVHIDALRRIAARDNRVQIIQDPFRLPMLLAQSDVAVTAGGSTCYECAYIGIPNVMVQTADNQSAVCRGMVEAGCSLFAGRAPRLERGSVLQALRRIVDDSPTRIEMAKRGRALVDGHGTERVCTELSQLVAARPESQAA